MAINVTTNKMTSNITDVVAVRQPNGRWTVTGRDGQEYDDNLATLAMLLAQHATRGLPDTPHTLAWKNQLRPTAATEPNGCRTKNS